jgi:O-antigen ligase
VGGLFWFLGERSFTINTPNIAKGIVCLPQAYSCLSWLRPYATFPHPNVFGGFLGIYILFFLTKFHSLVKKSPVLLRIFSYITFGFASLSLLISFSRAAWIGLITATALWIIPEKYQKRLFYVFLMGMTVLFIVSLLSPLPYFNDESIDIRLALNQAAVKILQHHPILGVGLNNFLFALPAFITTRTVYFLQPVHNIYLLVVSEIGLVGSLLVLSLVAFMIRKSSWSLRNDSLPLITFLLVIGMFDHYFLTIQQGQLLLILTLALCKSQKNQS